MPDYLLEVGCEELPASSVDSASAQLLQGIEARLREAGLAFGEGRRLGTPRRLIVGIAGIESVQADRSERKRGPAVAAAFDADGNPTKAMEGFCRGQGVDPSEAEREDDYVWVTKSIPGRSASEILAEIVPDAIREVHFAKTMRWGRGKMRFARPIRWILSVLDGEVVPFTLEGVAAGGTSSGHRVESPEPFSVKSWDELVSGLRERYVEPDPAERERRVREGAAMVASDQPELTDALVDEVTHITEWPEAIEGSFAEEHLGLPEPVLITAMAKHEKFFPQRDSDGKITRHFVSIRNGGDPDTVRRGNEWVLNARFNDAAFFYEEDKRKKLDDFLADTEGMNFLAGLGNVRQRADRLRELAVEAALVTHGHDDEVEQARQAGLYAKADLTTGLVSELASLQGIIGGEYARREGSGEEVCWAIATQYDLSKNPDAETAARRTALRLHLADQMDKLAGCLGMKQAPKGSSDPQGLRRAASGIIESAWRWNQPLVSFAPLFDKALERYEEQGFELDKDFARQAMVDVMESRYEAMLGGRHDIEQAALGNRTLEELLTPRLIRFRAAQLAEVGDDAALVQTMTRPLNIVRAAEEKGNEVPETCEHAPDLNSPDGEALWEEMRTVAPMMETMVYEENVAGVAAALRQLAGPINRFFDSTMIMDKEPKVRAARLGLLNEVRRTLWRAGDFTKIVLAGESADAPSA